MCINRTHFWATSPCRSRLRSDGVHTYRTMILDTVESIKYGSSTIDMAKYVTYSMDRLREYGTRRGEHKSPLTITMIGPM